MGICRPRLLLEMTGGGLRGVMEGGRTRTTEGRGRGREVGVCGVFRFGGMGIGRSGNLKVGRSSSFVALWGVEVERGRRTWG